MSGKIMLGFMKSGEYFILDGVKYKIGHLIKNTNGYIACIDAEHKVKRVHIDTLVEKVRRKRLDENFSSCGNDIVKDYCVDCGKKIIGEDTIKEIVKNRFERLAKAEERRKERIKSAADEECEE